MNMKEIIIVTRSCKPEIEEVLSDTVKWMSFDDLIANQPNDRLSIDIIFLCCSQNPSNIGFVNTQFLSKFQPGLYIVNVGRGGLLNYEDVYQALEDGRLAGLGIDVYHIEPFPILSEDPLLSHPRVVCTPHIGGVTEISYRNMAKDVAENVLRIAQHENPIGAVNNYSK